MGIKQWGMSEKVGAIALEAPSSGGPFMGREMGQRRTQWGGKIMGNVELEVDHLAKTLVEQEVVSAEEFQMMLVEYKVQALSYEVFGEERNRDKLPFQELPATV